jgi:hypothetical protein
MTSDHAQKGQALVIFVMVLAFVFSTLLYALTDYAQVSTAYHVTDTAAQVGASTAASTLDKDAFYRGEYRLAASALGDCYSAAGQQLSFSPVTLSGTKVSCSIQGTRVTVRITATIYLIYSDLGPSVALQTQRSAQGAYGQSHPISFP